LALYWVSFVMNHMRLGLSSPDLVKRRKCPLVAKTGQLWRCSGNFNEISKRSGNEADTRHPRCQYSELDFPQFSLGSRTRGSSSPRLNGLHKRMLPAISPSGSVSGEQFFLAGHCEETISIADFRYRTFDCDLADRGCAIQSFVVHGVSDRCNRRNLYGLLLEL
jgi:hypothetical protein